MLHFSVTISPWDHKNEFASLFSIEVIFFLILYNFHICLYWFLLKLPSFALIFHWLGHAGSWIEFRTPKPSFLDSLALEWSSQVSLDVWFKHNAACFTGDFLSTCSVTSLQWRQWSLNVRVRKIGLKMSKFKSS